VTVFVGQSMDLSGNHLYSKAPFISQIHKILNRVQKDGALFFSLDAVTSLFSSSTISCSYKKHFK